MIGHRNDLLAITYGIVNHYIPGVFSLPPIFDLPNGEKVLPFYNPNVFQLGPDPL